MPAAHAAIADAPRRSSATGRPRASPAARAPTAASPAPVESAISRAWLGSWYIGRPAEDHHIPLGPRFWTTWGQRESSARCARLVVEPREGGGRISSRLGAKRSSCGRAARRASLSNLA